MDRLKQLQKDHAAKSAEMQTLIAEGKLDEAEAKNTELEAIEAEITRIQAVAAKAAERAKFASEPATEFPVPAKGAAKAAASKIEAGASEVDKLAGTGGFKSLGHFAHCVYKGRSEESARESLKRWETAQIKAPTGMFEEADPDGGALVPREFSNRIYERMVDPMSIWPLITPITVRGNTLTLPRLKENSRVDGSRDGGILAYWDGEADQFTGSRPKFANLSLKLHKLTALVYMTEELLSDSAVGLESYLGMKVPRAIAFKVQDAVIQGDGVGKPLGIKNSGGTISVAKESGQAAATIVYANINKIHNRLLPTARSRAVWLAHLDTEPQIENLDTGTTNSSAPVLYSVAPDGTPRLKGRRLIYVEQCETLGTTGDLYAASFDGYAAIIKGAIESAMSMHLRFDYDEVAFKWRFRMDGQPYDNTPLTPFKGTVTTSHFVKLDTRA